MADLNEETFAGVLDTMGPIQTLKGPLRLVVEPRCPHDWRRMAASHDHQCWRCLMRLGEAAERDLLNDCAKHPGHADG